MNVFKGLQGEEMIRPIFTDQLSICNTLLKTGKNKAMTQTE